MEGSDLAYMRVLPQYDERSMAGLSKPISKDACEKYMEPIKIKKSGTFTVKNQQIREAVAMSRKECDE